MRWFAVALVLLLAVPARADMFQDASNAKLPEAVTNFGYGEQLAATAICTTSNGSAAVTGCNATTGMAPGMRLIGPGIPASTTIASGITATGFTMSAPAGAAAGAGLVSARAAFWSDLDGSDPSILRVPGRVAIGNASGVATTVGGTNYTVCATGSYCAAWAFRGADLAVSSQTGSLAVMGLSQASLGVDVNSRPIGVGGFIVADRNVPTSAGYFDTQREAVNGTKTYGVEIVSKNKGIDVPSTTPYAHAFGDYGLALYAGGDSTYGGAAANPSNTAIWIGLNSQPWNKGIVFDKAGLSGADGTTGAGNAISMGSGHFISWYGPGSGTAAFVQSEVTSSAAQQSIKFVDNNTTFQGQSSQRMLRLTDITGGLVANNVRMYNAAPGGNPSITAEGNDANINITMSPKAGGYLFVTTPVRTQGYTVATLPTGSVGMRAYVTDQLTTCAQIGAALTGGGAKKCPVFYDGVAWVGG